MRNLHKKNNEICLIYIVTNFYLYNLRISGFASLIEDDENINLYRCYGYN